MMFMTCALSNKIWTFTSSIYVTSIQEETRGCKTALTSPELAKFRRLAKAEVKGNTKTRALVFFRWQLKNE